MSIVLLFLFAMSEETVDSILEKALEGSHVRNGPDAIVIALHTSFLSEGYYCIATGDEVNDFQYGDVITARCIYTHIQ